MNEPEEGLLAKKDELIGRFHVATEKQIIHTLKKNTKFTERHT